MLGWNKTKDFNLAWLRKDLAAVDRARTPWLIAVIHPPWYALATNHNSPSTDVCCGRRTCPGQMRSPMRRGTYWKPYKP